MYLYSRTKTIFVDYKLLRFSKGYEEYKHCEVPEKIGYELYHCGNLTVIFLV